MAKDAGAPRPKPVRDVIDIAGAAFQSPEQCDLLELEFDRAHMWLGLDGSSICFDVLVERTDAERARRLLKKIRAREGWGTQGIWFPDEGESPFDPLPEGTEYRHRALPPPRPRRIRKRLPEVLKRPISCDFIETDLRDVVDLWSTIMNIEIVLASAVSQARDNLEITYKADNIPLERALAEALRPLGLTYAVRRGKVVITAQEGQP